VNILSTQNDISKDCENLSLFMCLVAKAVNLWTIYTARFIIKSNY